MDAFKGADKAFYFEFSLKENLLSDPSPSHTNNGDTYITQQST